MMNDLEICKRIAEIEGFKFYSDFDQPQIKINGGIANYNPLTDDALCFRLMFKYKVDIDNTKDGVHATCFDIGFKRPLGRYAFDENPNKAILLSIIEANK